MVRPRVELSIDNNEHLIVDIDYITTLETNHTNKEYYLIFHLVDGQERKIQFKKKSDMENQYNYFKKSMGFINK